MPKRQIITIDEDKCNGCGDCVVGCQEGALQIVDGVAKLVNESFCDGFGDCIGECPTGALKIEEKEAENFDLEATKEHVKNVRGEKAVEKMIKAQQKHAGDGHAAKDHSFGGCPGKKMMFRDNNEGKVENEAETEEVSIKSELRQWPVQIHLLSPQAAYFENADLLLTADCVPVAYGDYHQKLLKDKIVAMGCPKLDQADAYVDRLAAIIAQNKINSITIAKMEVPCCGGLVRIAQQALKEANSDLEVEIITIGVDGSRK